MLSPICLQSVDTLNFSNIDPIAAMNTTNGLIRKNQMREELFEIQELASLL